MPSMIDLAIIGGTGIGTQLEKFDGKALYVSTPYGTLKGKAIEYKKSKLYLIQRHSIGHKTPPHSINFKAMAYGLKKLGVKACFSTAAVGSVRADWGPGTMSLCSDFIDFSGRNQTLFQNNVEHTDFSYPYNEHFRQAIIKAAEKLDLCLYTKCVYACFNGPRYETAAEIKMLQKVGCDVVGMTAATETILMGEAQIPYICLAIVTNLAAGLDAPALSHQEVVTQMEMSGSQAVKLLLKTAAFISEKNEG